MTEKSQFYEKHIRRLSKNPVSQVSGESIWNVWAGNIAHILPKRRYKSVALHDLNVIYLTDKEHIFMDQCLDGGQLDKLRDEMPRVYNFIIKRVRKMEQLGLIKESGKLISNLRGRI